MKRSLVPQISTPKNPVAAPESAGLHLPQVYSIARLMHYPSREGIASLAPPTVSRGLRPPQGTVRAVGAPTATSKERGIFVGTGMVFFAISLLVPQLLPFPFQLEDVLLPVFFTMAAFRKPLPSRLKAIVAATAITAALLATFGLVGHVFVEAPPTFSKSTASAIKEIGRLGKLVLVVFACAQLSTISEKQLTFVRRAVTMLLGLHLVIGLAQYYRVEPITSWLELHYLENSRQLGQLQEAAIKAGTFRATGTVYNPNIYGYLAVVMAGVACALRGSRTNQLGVMAAMVMCVLLSQSRTAFVGALALIYWMTASTGRTWVFRSLAAGAAGVLVILAVDGGASERITSIFSAEGFIQNRPQYRMLPRLVLRESPAFGLGIGAVWRLPPDSDFLYALMKTGLWGVMVLVTYYAYVIISRRSQYDRGLVFSGLAVIGGLTNGFFFGNEIAPWAALLLALLCNQERNSRLAHPERRSFSEA